VHSEQYKSVTRQGDLGEWYFHRYKGNIESFLRSNRNGLDITFGDKPSGTYGGILIKVIQDVETRESTSGINKVVRKLIEKINHENVDWLATKVSKFVFNADSILHLRNQENINTKSIYKDIRVLPDSEKDEKFYVKPYRYFNYPEIVQVNL